MIDIKNVNWNKDLYNLNLTEEVNKDKDTVLHYVLKNNKQENINLSQEQLDYLIKNSDLKKLNKFKNNALNLVLIYNKRENLFLQTEQFDYLIKKSNLKNVNLYDYTALMCLILNNEEKNLNFNKEQFNYLIKNCDLKLQNKLKYNTFMLFLMKNKSANINLNEEQINYLIENSNLNQKNGQEKNILMLLIQCYEKEKINLTAKQLEKIIKESDLKNKDNEGNNIFQYLIEFQKILELINENLMIYLLDESKNEMNPYLINNLELNKKNKLLLKQILIKSNEPLIVKKDVIQYLIENNDILNEVFPFVDNKAELINEIKKSKKDNLLELEEIKNYLIEKSFLLKFKKFFNVNINKKKNIEIKNEYQITENKINFIKEKNIDIEINIINEINTLIKDLKNKGDIKINTELDTFYISLFNNLLDNILLVDKNKNGEKYIQLYEKSLEELKTQLMELEKDNDKTLINIKEINKQLSMKKR